MSKTKLNTLPRVLALAGALSLFASASGFAAIVPDGTPLVPGVSLGGTANFGGTALLDVTTSFAENANTPAIFTGNLRTVVVRNSSGLLDFYYQVSNIVSDDPQVFPADIFRLTIDKFDGFATGEMDFSTNGLDGITGVNPYTNGNKSPLTADRDPGIGTGVGFTFATDPFLFFGDPNNLNDGDTSFIMVVRTNATEFTDSTAIISGFGTAVANTYAPSAAVSPIPEPGSALIGLAVFGMCASGFVRRSRPSTSA